MAKSEQDPGLPIKVNPASNGEFYPPPPNEIAVEAARRTLQFADRAARKRGISRREFLLSSAGSAAMLSIIAACSNERSQANPSTSATGTTEGPGGTYSVPEEATIDSTAAREAMGGDEFIFDVQGHFLEYPEGTPLAVPNFPQASCDLVDPHDCFDAGVVHRPDLWPERHECDHPVGYPVWGCTVLTRPHEAGHRGC
jgi:hypothetical protein